MTYGALNNAVPVLNKLVLQNLRLRQAYQLTKIAKRVNDELAFFNAKYQEIMNGDFPDDEKIKMMNELLNFEVEWDVEPLVFSVNDDLILSASDLEMGRGLVEIREEPT
ncbi:MAG: hypothetical protein E7576_07285 [Ruminococcaceae bacterium]|nr:hypothetical protein [Oscillospiraceae bacterium]